MSRRLHLLPLLLAVTLLFGAVPAAASTHAHLRFLPNPVKLKQRFTVTLTGARPGEMLTFLATPEREGFGGGNMGNHRANSAGTIQFHYGPFKNKMDVGHWTVTVVRKGTQVASATFKVVMPKKAKPARKKKKS
jgi:hypothetical protein